MYITRRSMLATLAGGAAALTLRRNLNAEATLDIQKGPFVGTRESLQGYQIPDWFRDAKFGIWSHWGPQSAVEHGDWYARNMYIQGSPQYDYHIARYGHPSKVGYKDLCPQWKAADFDPEYLMGLYKKAGAKYFVSMGVHHDNFDLWNSKYNRWNAVKMGPHKDIVGLWRKAALNRGLKFGVSEHLWISYKWFGVSHGSDAVGPLAGVPYDGTNSAYSDIYHDAGAAMWSHPKDFQWNADGIPDSWRHHWFLRMKDLVDNYQPDLLYTDGALPFESYGCGTVANLLNQSARLHGGQAQAVYSSKEPKDCAIGTCVLDIERGLANELKPTAWQTDTCIGDWHYNIDLYQKHGYKSAKTVVDLLVDIVSQNGNLLLNIPLPNSGTLDSDELQVVEGITDWMAVNSEAIYGTRPWKIYGEGPSTQKQKPGGGFNENDRAALTAADTRFTAKGSTLYAFVMGWPEKQAVVKALGSSSPQSPGKIENVDLLGYKDRVRWKQDANALTVDLPSERPSNHAIAFKVIFA